MNTATPAARTLRIYVAGPMTGMPEFNYPAFNAEARVWRARGFEVENPAEGPDLPSWAAYMRRALRQLLTCDAICLLPGWTTSKGATVEWLVASVLGLQLVYHTPPDRTQVRLLRLLARWMPSSVPTLFDLEEHKTDPIGAFTQLLPKAIELTREHQRLRPGCYSVSRVQRLMGVSYVTAAHLVETIRKMDEEGAAA